MMSKFLKVDVLTGMKVAAGVADAQTAGYGILNLVVWFGTQVVSVGKLKANNATYQSFVTGASSEASDETTVLFGVTRMFTDNIGAELALGTPPRIKLDINTPNGPT